MVIHCNGRRVMHNNLSTLLNHGVYHHFSPICLSVNLHLELVFAFFNKSRVQRVKWTEFTCLLSNISYVFHLLSNISINGLFWKSLSRSKLFAGLIVGFVLIWFCSLNPFSWSIYLNIVRHWLDLFRWYLSWNFSLSLSSLIFFFY